MTQNLTQMKRIIGLLILTIIIISCKKVDIEPQVLTERVYFEVFSTDTMPKHLIYGYDNVVKELDIDTRVLVYLDVPIGAHCFNLILQSRVPTHNKIAIYQRKIDDSCAVDGHKCFFYKDRTNSCALNEQFIKDYSASVVFQKK